MEPWQYYEDFVCRANNDFLKCIKDDNSSDKDIVYHGKTACIYANQMPDYLWVRELQGKGFIIPSTNQIVTINDANLTAKLLAWQNFKIVNHVANSTKHRKLVSTRDRGKFVKGEVDTNLSAGSVASYFIPGTQERILQLTTNDNNEDNVSAALAGLIDEWADILKQLKE